MKDKISKLEANYRRATGDKKCGNCVMFRKPSACTLVRGKISATDTCDKWEKKP